MASNTSINMPEGTENVALIPGSTGTSNDNNSKRDLVEELKFGPIPKKRGNKADYLSVIVIFCSTVFVLVVYLKEKRDSTVILHCALTFFGVILGTLVNCLCLAFEEWFHYKERYEGSLWKMFKTCFSVIDKSMFSLGIILSFSLVYVMLYHNTTGEGLQLFHAAIIFSNIGIGALIHHLLKVGKQSEIQISNINEENKTFVANALAWHYYYDRLEVVLTKLKRGEIQQSHNSPLNSPKLFILIPLNCNIHTELGQNHKGIRKDGVIKCMQTSYELSVYKIGIINALRIMIEFPSSLNTIFKMCKDETKRNEQTRLFYRALKDILKTEGNEIQEQYMLIPYEKETLLEYGLAKLIRELVPKRQNFQPIVTGNSELRQRATTHTKRVKSDPEQYRGNRDLKIYDGNFEDDVPQIKAFFPKTKIMNNF